jgi:hypothetical protein
MIRASSLSMKRAHVVATPHNTQQPQGQLFYPDLTVINRLAAKENFAASRALNVAGTVDQYHSVGSLMKKSSTYRKPVKTHAIQRPVPMPTPYHARRGDSDDSPVTVATTTHTRMHPLSMNSTLYDSAVEYVNIMNRTRFTRFHEFRPSVLETCFSVSGILSLVAFVTEAKEMCLRHCSSLSVKDYFIQEQLFLHEATELYVNNKATELEAAENVMQTLLLQQQQQAEERKEARRAKRRKGHHQDAASTTSEEQSATEPPSLLSLCDPRKKPRSHQKPAAIPVLAPCPDLDEDEACTYYCVDDDQWQLGVGVGDKRARSEDTEEDNADMMPVAESLTASPTTAFSRRGSAGASASRAKACRVAFDEQPVSRFRSFHDLDSLTSVDSGDCTDSVGSNCFQSELTFLDCGDCTNAAEAVDSAPLPFVRFNDNVVGGDDGDWVSKPVFTRRRRAGSIVSAMTTTQLVVRRTETKTQTRSRAKATTASAATSRSRGSGNESLWNASPVVCDEFTSVAAKIHSAHHVMGVCSPLTCAVSGANRVLLSSWSPVVVFVLSSELPPTQH